MMMFIVTISILVISLATISSIVMSSSNSPIIANFISTVSTSAGNLDQNQYHEPVSSAFSKPPPLPTHVPKTAQVKQAMNPMPNMQNQNMQADGSHH